MRQSIYQCSLIRFLDLIQTKILRFCEIRNTATNIVYFRDSYLKHFNWNNFSNFHTWTFKLWKIMARNLLKIWFDFINLLSYSALIHVFLNNLKKGLRFTKSRAVLLENFIGKAMGDVFIYIEHNIKWLIA